MKSILKISTLSVLVSSAVLAGGYNIHGQSLNSMALGAYTAHTMGADSAYHNPANMSFMNDGQYLEGGLTLRHYSSNKFAIDSHNANIESHDADTGIKNRIFPNLHYVSNAYENFRWGVSLVTPANISRTWDSPMHRAFVEKFTLDVIELNPAVSYKLMDNLSIAAGIRLIYSEFETKSDGSAFSATIKNPMVNNARYMEADTFEWGYNLALSYKPTNDISFAVTYRSNVDLDHEGKTTLSFGKTMIHHGYASLSMPLPATLNMGLSKTWQDKYTLEFNYERTFWSKYEKLDYEYGDAQLGLVKSAFGVPIAKNWEDTNTYRLSATAKIDDKFTVMAGFALDETPAPLNNLGFELLDSDSKIYSAGLRYQQTDNLSWGIALSYDDKESLTIPTSTTGNPNPNDPVDYDTRGIVSVNVGASYRF